MKKWRIEYKLEPDDRNVVITVSAATYEDACIYAKEFRREGFSVEEIQDGLEEIRRRAYVIYSDMNSMIVNLNYLKRRPAVRAEDELHAKFEEVAKLMRQASDVLYQLDDDLYDLMSGEG